MKPEFSRLFTRLLFRMSLSFTAAKAIGSWAGWGTSTGCSDHGRDRARRAQKPDPGRFTREEKSMAIDLQYKGTAALADGRRLPSDLTGALQGTRLGVTHRGTHPEHSQQHRWPPHLHRVTAGSTARPCATKPRSSTSRVCGWPLAVSLAGHGCHLLSLPQLDGEMASAQL